MHTYSKHNNPIGCYVYAYLRVDGTPYYIGKGVKSRAWASHPRKHSKVNLPEDKTRIIIMESNLTDIGALALERFYIRWYGRKLDNGILINITEGGDGVCGIKHSETTKKLLSELKKGQVLSTNHKHKISESMKGRGDISDDHKHKISESMKGRVLSAETKQKMSLAKIGKPKSEEHKQKMSERKKGLALSDEHKQNLRKTKRTLQCPHCSKIGGSNGMVRFHFDKCKSRHSNGV